MGGGPRLGPGWLPPALGSSPRLLLLLACASLHPCPMVHAQWWAECACMAATASLFSEAYLFVGIVAAMLGSASCTSGALVGQRIRTRRCSLVLGKCFLTNCGVVAHFGG